MYAMLQFCVIMSVPFQAFHNGTDIDKDHAPEPGCKNKKKDSLLSFFYIYLLPPKKTKVGLCRVNKLIVN